MKAAILLGVLVAACARRDPDYDWREDSGNIEYLHDYLVENPQGKSVVRARKKLLEHGWKARAALDAQPRAEGDGPETMRALIDWLATHDDPTVPVRVVPIPEDGPTPVLAVAYRVAATDKLYKSGGTDRRAFRGVRFTITARLHVPGRAPLQIETRVDPPENFTFSTSPLTGVVTAQYPDSDAQDDDVYAGAADHAFKQLELAFRGRIVKLPATPHPY